MLTDIYLHLDSDELAKAVATDERSYRKEMFDVCVRLLHKNNIKNNVSVMYLHICCVYMYLCVFIVLWSLLKMGQHYTIGTVLDVKFHLNIYYTYVLVNV